MNLLGFSVDNDTERRVLHIRGKAVDMFDGEWMGTPPDVHVLRSLESIDKEVICSPNNKTKDCTIVRDTISREEYLRKIPRGKGRREIADRYCYLDGDKDKNTCRMFDINNLPGIKELSFDFDDGSPSLIVGKLPDASANRLSFLLSKMYSTKLGIEGLDLDSGDLKNSHNMRGDPCRGCMSSFGTLEIIENGSKDYKNTRAFQDLLEVLKELNDIVFGWLSVEHPDVMRQMKEDNKNYHGCHPPYTTSDTCISPWMVISWQLGNEGHKDPNDNGLSVVIWVVDINNIDLSACTDWRFVFQNLSTGLDDVRRDTTSIPLFHGIVIIYDGKKIRHATTIPLDKSIHRFGLFHGSTNPKGYLKWNPNKQDK